MIQSVLSAAVASRLALLCGALALLLSPAGRAQSVDLASPAAGSVGTYVELEGSGFGPSKPKVWIESEAEPGKRRAVKVLLNSDGWLSARIVARKLPAGPCRLWVKAKGSAAPFSGPAVFEVLPPVIEDFQPKGVLPGGLVTLHGQHFGSFKGRVELGGQRLPVKSWQDDRIIVRTRHQSGVLSVQLSSGTAESWCPLALIVGDPPATGTGQTFVLLSGDLTEWPSGPTLVRTRLAEDGQTLTVVALGSAHLVELVVTVETGTAPVHPTALLSVDLVRVRSLGGALEPDEWLATDLPPGAASLSGPVGTCTFRLELDATLGRVGGEGAESLDVHLFAQLDPGLIAH